MELVVNVPLLLLKSLVGNTQTTQEHLMETVTSLMAEGSLLMGLVDCLQGRRYGPAGQASVAKKSQICNIKMQYTVFLYPNRSEKLYKPTIPLKRTLKGIKMNDSVVVFRTFQSAIFP